MLSLPRGSVDWNLSFEQLIVVCFSRSREGAWIEMNIDRMLKMIWISRSREGAWIEMDIFTAVISGHHVAPARERGLKFLRRCHKNNVPFGRSREGAWIEMNIDRMLKMIWISRSREGAWIEMDIFTAVISGHHVAPARERGLKFLRRCHKNNVPFGRSREGAWIEIQAVFLASLVVLCRSREGAWIEIPVLCRGLKKVRRRSREGAWIEISWLIAS